MAVQDWDEIKRLASDFKRIQHTASSIKLSERNCIEIINKLIQKELLSVYFTSSGREYITPEYLSTLIQDELYANSGRINLTELSSIIDVSLNVIEKTVSDLCSKNPHLHLVLGQLISNDYFDFICEEIHEKLKLSGFLTMTKIAQLYDLPGKVAKEAISKRLGRIIKGKMDESHTLYTEVYVAKHEHQIKGVFSTLFHPKPLSAVIQKYGFQENLFFSLLEKIVKSGFLRGSVTAFTSHGVYTPFVYQEAQSKWAKEFFKQNSYFTYASMTSLGISDPQNFIKRNLSDVDLIFIRGGCVSNFIVDQINLNIEDTIAAGSFVDLMPFLPDEFNEEMCMDLIKICIDKRAIAAKSSGCALSTPLVFCGSYVVSETLLLRLTMSFDQLMKDKAREYVQSGAYKKLMSSQVGDSSSKKKDVHKKDSDKKVKNKRGSKKNKDDSDDEQAVKKKTLPFMSTDDLKDSLANNEDLSDATDDLLEEIALYLQDSLECKFQGILMEEAQTITAAEGGSRKKNYKQMQEKVVALMTSIKSAEKSIQEFPADVQDPLMKYLLKTHCAEVLNEVTQYLADEADIATEAQLTTESRLKVIGQLPKNVGPLLLVSHKAKTCEDFSSSIDDTLDTVGIIIKKKDNKKEKEVLFNHRSSLVEQLQACVDPAVTLHISCLVLFQTVSGTILQASGKFVPNIIRYLGGKVPEEFHSLLRECQDIVMKAFNKKEGEEGVETEAKMSELKEKTISFKKDVMGSDNA